MSDSYKLKRIRDGRDFALSEVSLLVGRSDSCDIQVTAGHPSREHARVVAKDGGVLVQDLHSTNGTFVNNKRIEIEARLQIGDVVKFGDETFAVQSADAPEATVLMRSLGSSSDQSAMVVEEDDDEDDQDSTSFLEVYAMPPGWEKGPSFDNDVGKLDERKQQAIDRYLEKFSKSLKGKKGLFLVLFSEDEPPIFKSLVVDAGSNSWRFGRSEDCDVTFDNPCISKHHATITYDDSGWTIKDENSTNGIAYNGRKQEKLSLGDNMTFEISSVDVLVRFLK